MRNAKNIGPHWISATTRRRRKEIGKMGGK